MFQSILLTCFIVFGTCYSKENSTMYKTEAECLVAAESNARKLIEVIKQKTKEPVTIHYGCRELKLV